MIVDGADTLPTYEPAMRIISNITNANPAQVTTSFAHGYSTGTTVRLNVPAMYGMENADKLTGTITVTGATTFTIPIDTTGFDPFTPHPTFVPTPIDPIYPWYKQSMVVPIGEANEVILAATRNVLPR